MTPYLILSTVMFFLLGFAWVKKPLMNFFLKMFFHLIAFWGALETLKHMGYIIKR